MVRDAWMRALVLRADHNRSGQRPMIERAWRGMRIGFPIAQCHRSKAALPVRTIAQHRMCYIQNRYEYLILFLVIAIQRTPIGEFLFVILRIAGLKNLQSGGAVTLWMVQNRFENLDLGGNTVHSIKLMEVISRAMCNECNDVSRVIAQNVKEFAGLFPRRNLRCGNVLV